MLRRDSNSEPKDVKLFYFASLKHKLLFERTIFSKNWYILVKNERFNFKFVHKVNDNTYKNDLFSSKVLF